HRTSRKATSTSTTTAATSPHGAAHCELEAAAAAPAARTETDACRWPMGRTPGNARLIVKVSPGSKGASVTVRVSSVPTVDATLKWATGESTTFPRLEIRLDT